MITSSVFDLVYWCLFGVLWCSAESNPPSTSRTTLKRAWSYTLGDDLFRRGLLWYRRMVHGRLILSHPDFSAWSAICFLCELVKIVVCCLRKTSSRILFAISGNPLHFSCSEPVPRGLILVNKRVTVASSDLTLWRMLLLSGMGKRDSSTNSHMRDPRRTREQSDSILSANFLTVPRALHPSP